MAGKGSNKPLFTVLLPTHNRADVLPYAIRSVLSQTLASFELIIVGDGCTDNTHSVVSAFDDPRIVWLNLRKAPGMGYANRNAGLRLAQGETIAYQAHDDLWLPDHLETMLDALRTSQAEFAYSRALSVKLDGSMWPQAANLHNASLREHFLSGHHVPLPSCTVVHTRECLHRYDYWDETLLRNGDHEMWRRIIAAGGGDNLAYVPYPTTVRFIAGWRRRNRGWRETPRRLVLSQLDRSDRMLPTELRLDLRGCSTEQEAMWRLIESDPAGAARKLRQATVAYQDSLLWEYSGLVTRLFARAGRPVQSFVRQVSRWQSGRQARH